jgi:hypothetical protein
LKKRNCCGVFDGNIPLLATRHQLRELKFEETEVKGFVHGLFGKLMKVNPDTSLS